MVDLFANSGDPDQMPSPVASDLGLHCLRITLLGDSRLHWVNTYICNIDAQKTYIVNIFCFIINCVFCVLFSERGWSVADEFLICDILIG